MPPVCSGTAKSVTRFVNITSMPGEPIADLPLLLRVQRLWEPSEGVDLWCCRVEDVPASLLANPESVALLSQQELERHSQFRLARDRHLFLASRVLVRCVLSHFVPQIGPAEWEFVRGRFGRPELAPALSARVRSVMKNATLSFNLSHSGSLAICAATLSGEVGADVEDTSVVLQLTELVDRVLTQEEKREWACRPEKEQRLAFFRSWVRKEAYVKACGVGLNLELSRISFDESRTGCLRARQDGRWLGSWLFADVLLFDHYVAAVAFRSRAPQTAFTAGADAEERSQRQSRRAETFTNKVPPA